nr:hypothetical protein [Endozoicomonas sp.]
MHAAGASTQTGYSYSQSQSDNTVSQTKHWTQSRTVRAVAGLAVLGLGALTALTVSFFASTFAAIIAAAAVTVVSAFAVVGYFSHHSSNTITPAFSTATTSKPPVYHPFPAADNSGKGRSTAENIRLQEENVRRLLEGYGYRFYQSSLDGNCFYDSIAHQCPEIARNATELRRKVADFARNWQHYSNDNQNFSVLEACAYARLLNDVGNEVGGHAIATGLEEIATTGRYSDQIDAFFTAQVTRRPIVIIDRNGEVKLAVDENGKAIDWTQSFNRELFPQNSILLVHDGGHFMGRSILPNRPAG